MTGKRTSEMAMDVRVQLMGPNHADLGLNNIGDWG